MNEVSLSFNKKGGLVNDVKDLLLGIKLVLEDWKRWDAWDESAHLHSILSVRLPQRRRMIDV